MRRTILALLAVGTLLSALPAGAAFENLAPSPRARAMGDAGVALGDDVFAPYYNPAGLAAQVVPGVGVSYLRPYGVDFADLIYGSVVVPAGRYGTLGFSLRRFGVSWDQDPWFDDGSGEVDLLRETTFTLSHGVRIYQDLHTTVSAGWALNAYNLDLGPTVATDPAETIDPGSDTVVGLDAALLVVLHERTRLGVLATGINDPQIGQGNEEIPQRVHGGIAYEPYIGVVTTFEFESRLGEDVQYHGGVEFEAAEGLDLRVGAISNPSKLTVGFGYQRLGLGVDYGFSTGGGTLDASHQFGLRYAWGGEER